MKPPPLPPPPRPPRFPPRDPNIITNDAWDRKHGRDSMRTLFAVRARVGLVWALISLAFGAGAYILVRALL